ILLRYQDSGTGYFPGGAPDPRPPSLASIGSLAHAAPSLRPHRLGGRDYPKRAGADALMNECAQPVGLADLPFADVSVHPGVQRILHPCGLVLVGYVDRHET